jgi:N-acetylglutamate synthase and related acetyltransferases
MEKIEIVEYSDEYKDYFKKLNCEWIEKFFVIEPTDEYVLNNPEDAVLKTGGYIYFAKLDEEIVGTFAMMKIDDTTYEFAKMAVSERFQNRGIGKMLLNVAFYKAKELGLERLVLYSNTYLESAVSLYRRFGFLEIPKTDFHNNRANLKMEKVFGRSLEVSHYSQYCEKGNNWSGEFDVN